jgi:hypothetical protein
MGLWLSLCGQIGRRVLVLGHLIYVALVLPACLLAFVLSHVVPFPTVMKRERVRSVVTLGTVSPVIGREPWVLDPFDLLVTTLGTAGFIDRRNFRVGQWLSPSNG